MYSKKITDKTLEIAFLALKIALLFGERIFKTNG